MKYDEEDMFTNIYSKHRVKNGLNIIDTKDEEYSCEDNCIIYTTCPLC